MGNSISTFDYDTQLSKCQDFDYAAIVDDPEPNLEFGPVYRSKLYPEMCPGYIPLKSTDNKIIYNVLEIVLQSFKLTNGGESEFLGQREWRVQDQATAPVRSEAEIKALPKSYQKTGYVERKDGTVDRFAYKWLSHNQTHDIYSALGRGLVHMGIPLESKIGIFAVNRPEWVLSMYALYSQAMTVVPLYATLGPDSIEYIVKHAEVPAVIVSKENFAALAKTLPKLQDSALKHIILIDCIADGLWGNTLDVVTDEHKKALEGTGISITGLSNVIALGNTNEAKSIPQTFAGKDDLAFIMYTSGTTGTPKGVMLAHSCLSGCLHGCSRAINLISQDTYFSYLPLAHIFEVILNLLTASAGMKIAFSQGDVRQIVGDLQASKPHLLPGVPRIWTKFYQNVWASVENMSWFKKFYIYRAYNHQLSLLRQNSPLDASYDERVFKTMREKMGLDNIRVMVTGAAPCPPYLVEFMRVLSNAWFSQGYGMTESCAGTAVSPRNDHLIGHCGAPMPSVEYRLASVPDMGYLYTDNEPKGELLMCGPSVFKGYYKNEEATAETLVNDSKGRVWLRTGDIARINPLSGSISIIDRKKFLFKLSQGEYVSIDKLINTYSQSPYVSQIFAYGNAFKNSIVAVVVPNIIPLYDFAVAQQWWSISDKPIQGALSDEVIAEFQRINKEHKDAIEAWIKPSLTACESTLLGFEKIKAFVVDVDFDSLGLVFTEAKGLMTPTLKLKYQPLAKEYHEILSKMYTSIDEPDQPGDKYW